jgi:hypothetical protein
MSDEATTPSTTETPAATNEGGASATATLDPGSEGTAAATPSLADVQREKLEALRLRNESRKAKLAGANLSAREKAIAEQEAAAKARLADYSRDPVAALRAAGFDPLEALDALATHANSTTEPATKADLKRFADLEAKLAKFEAEREAERNAREHAEAAEKHRATERQATEAFLGVLKAEKYKPLEVWEPGELVAHANQIANALQAKGKRFTFADVADELLKSHDALARRFSPAAVASPSASVPAPATVNGGRPASRTKVPQATEDTTVTAPRQTLQERIQELADKASARKLR